MKFGVIFLKIDKRNNIQSNNVDCNIYETGM